MAFPLAGILGRAQSLDGPLGPTPVGPGSVVARTSLWRAQGLSPPSRAAHKATQGQDSYPPALARTWQEARLAPIAPLRHLVRKIRNRARRSHARDGQWVCCPRNSDGAALTPEGEAFLASLGLDLDASRARRVFCRPCLDWSERRPHLAGAIGAALCTLSLEQTWFRRMEGGRALEITPRGFAVLRERFDLELG